ncbi:alpha-fetoprotein-like isoform X4 [Choloepus didactylus]|uniref:alpha-fetoprotein-like isoform X4 n=1 Tax=Choloepus didactylus TaxID=27675 RepID=UPI00189E54B8|nr:alpha-fetoprotein-like isoform X4 [Choloepus didactylus]
MKTIRLIYFLVFLGYIKCQILQRSLQDAAMKYLKSQNYLEENLRDITSIMVAQFLQKVTYEDVQTIVQELLNTAEKCKGFKPHESPSECSHQMMITFLEHICNNQGMVDKYGVSDCCNKNYTARHKCLLSHKKDDAEYSDVFQIPNPEQILDKSCETDKENPGSVRERYIYETSRQHPFLYGPTILTMSACYETAIESCCQEDNKTECLQIKLEPIRKYITEMSLRHHHLCEIGNKFNHRIAKAVELVLLTKKQPKADFSEIAKLTMDTKSLHQTCCEGNTVECVLGRKEMLQRVVNESHERVKNYCDLYKKLGDGNFHNWLIVLYYKKVPQLSAQELVVLTKNLAAAATKCCPLGDEKQFNCIEDSAKLIFGALCRRHEAEPISAGVDHCCDDAYAFRKICFDDLQGDATYVSPSLPYEQVISLEENLCKAQEEKIQTEKLNLLSNLVKRQPQLTEMQLLSIIAQYTDLVQTCCEAEKSENCFQEKGSKLTEEYQSLLGG